MSEEEEEEEHQVCTLLYCLGEEAEDVLTSTNITAQSRKKYGNVLGKFNDFFEVRKNVVYECTQLNWVSQWEDKIVEYYITSLYSFTVSLVTQRTP